MSRYNGTAAALTYGEALVETARRVPWASQEERDEVVKAIQVQHGLYVVPEAQVRAEEEARLRELVEAKRAADAAAATEANIASMRAELGLDAQAPATDPTPDGPHAA